jgi:hypothetical protein
MSIDGVWLESVDSGSVSATYALDEVDYYDWVGAWPLELWPDCTAAAAGEWRLRFQIWDGRPDVIEPVELRLPEPLVPARPGL